jgi:hypothetical protein
MGQIQELQAPDGFYLEIFQEYIQDHQPRAQSTGHRIYPGILGDVHSFIS